MNQPPPVDSPTGGRASGRDLFWTFWAMAAAFGCYFCMYGFRKPFTAGAFAETTLGGLSFKTVLVTAQVAGYALSKFIGIKVIAEMPAHRRAASLLGLILLAQASLLLFGIVPRPWNAVCLFFNGLPLGMVFGLVLSFLEGRQMTEALAAGLCASFILADGATKSVGTWLLTQGISEDWMPALAGALFLAPLGVCVTMLVRVPPPSADDVAARNERRPMHRADRWAFVARYAGGLIPLVLMYLAVTIVRSIRADFAPEIWRGLGDPAAPETFTRSEVWVAAGVLLVNGSAVLIRDNRRAFFASLATCGGGVLLLATALLLRSRGVLASFDFMVLAGVGLYLPYVAMHTTVFERLLAMTREPGNLGFLMYVADSTGYLGYVGVMLLRGFGPARDDYVGLLTTASSVAIAVSLVCLLQSAWYFRRPRGAAALPDALPARAS